MNQQEIIDKALAPLEAKMRELNELRSENRILAKLVKEQKERIKQAQETYESLRGFYEQRGQELKEFKEAYIEKVNQLSQTERERDWLARQLGTYGDFRCPKRWADDECTCPKKCIDEWIDYAKEQVGKND